MKLLLPLICLGLAYCVFSVGIRHPAITPYVTYINNLYCHSLGGNYYWNNPASIRCVNTEPWEQALTNQNCWEDETGNPWCKKQRFYKIYTNENLNWYGKYEGYIHE